MNPRFAAKNAAPAAVRPAPAWWITPAACARPLVALLLCLSLGGCGGGDPAEDDTGSTTLSLRFDHLDPEWQLGFSDYTDGTEPADVSLRLTEVLPAPVGQRAVALAGVNRSDDAYVYIKRPVTGLRPLSSYQAHVSVTLAASVPQGCMGVGGAPGEAVFVKTTVSRSEPQTLRQADGEWVLSVDKGNQAESGREGRTLGHIANSALDCHYGSTERKTLMTPTPISVSTDLLGRLWWGLGMDSGYESGSSLVLLEASLTLTRR